MTIRIWKGIAGRKQEVSFGDVGPVDIKRMDPDEVQKRTSTGQTLACAGCGKPWQQAQYTIKCGACMTQDWPALTVFQCCEGCGGEAELMAQYSAHRRRAHVG